MFKQVNTMKENTNNKNNKKTFYIMLYAMMLFVTLYPVSCNYIPDSGMAREWAQWLARFMPDDTVVILWRLCMLLIQTVTLLGSILFFETFFKKGKYSTDVFYGVLLYMTCPYRIYVCFDKMDIVQAAAWMLLPLYGWMVLKICKPYKNSLNITDNSVKSNPAGNVGMVSICIRAIIICLLTIIIGAVFLTGSRAGQLRYVFNGSTDIAGTQPHTIMQNGYRFTEYFTSYTWRDGHPGMGMGMVICMTVMLWLALVKGRKAENKGVKVCLIMAVICAIMAFYYFPWDFVQRLGTWSLKLISIIDTPAVFAGAAYALLSAAGADTVRAFEESEGSKAGSALKIIVLAACLGLCIYQCNMLTYTRIPLVFY